MWNGLLAAVLGYLLGSIPFGYLLGRLRGVDVRRYGSGATGGTNVLRTLGWGPALATAVTDVSKGLLAGYLGYLIADRQGYALGAFMAIVGHSYPVWLGFKGGKSVATSAGAILLFHPWAFLVALLVGLGAIFPTRYVSLGSLIGAMVLCGTVWLTETPMPDKLLALGIFLVIYIRHWENMKRLASGTENKFGQQARARQSG